nr:uncharacterized protein LOC112006549 isoform X1 [Quercus suber]
MDTSGGRISLLYLQFLDPISDAKKYSWGSAALAWLYRQLCNATDLKAKHISGALLLVQLWAFARFPHMVPKMKEPLQGALDPELPLGPHAIRWQGAKCTKNTPTHVLEAYRASFSMTQAHQIVWEPYKEVLSTLPTYCTAGQRVWRSVVPLICFWIVEFHHPERVLRQFGMQQGEPPIVNTSVKLHGITLRAKMDKDWRKEHAVYIQQWDSRDQRVHDAPVFDGVMQYNHSYMKWYRRITRCHISRNSVKWDIIVNTQLRMLSRCQPNSENYKDIMDVLDVVGEMNRVNLDSARAVSSTRTPVAGHGRRSGGRGGRRGGRGFGRGSSHDQEHSDSDEYPPSAVDIDSDSDYGLSIDDIGIRPCMIHHDIGPSTTHDTPPSPLPTTLHDDIGPSYTHDASSSPLPLTPNDDIEPSTTHGAPWFPLPSTPMSATLTTNVASTDLAGGSSRVFIPILGLPTPHHHFPTRSTQIHSLPKPQQEVARVEQPHGKNVEQLEPPPPKYLKCTRNEKSSCGTGEEIAQEIPLIVLLLVHPTHYPHN